MKEKILATVDAKMDGELILHSAEKDPDYVREYKLSQAKYPTLSTGDAVWLEFENQYLVWVTKITKE